MSKIFRQMIAHDASGGALLAFAALVALLIANSGANVFYEALLSVPITISIANFEIAKPLLLWVNDGLMAIFFFMVGLEIKREILDGHLSSLEQIVLPGVGALAGIAVPAIIYVFFNQHDAIAIKGWAIPSATDIAFALGVFSLFSNKVPISLKLFLLSVAIFDDIGAIVIIAVFYSEDISTVSFIVAFIGLAALFIINRFKVNHLGPYVFVAVIVWAAVLKSGVHATLAGFIVAWFIPLKLLDEDGKPMLPRLEHALHPWVAFFILPFFAFANAGVQFVGIGLESLFSPMTIGITLGLFAGKQLGIFGFCWLVIKCRLAKLPEGATWVQFYAVCLLCGIGFTMSLFIGSLAFEQQTLDYQNNVKIGVLVGSLLSAIVGALLLGYSGQKVTQPRGILNEAT